MGERDNMKIFVFDISGKLYLEESWLSGEGETKTVNIERLPRGIYIFKIGNDRTDMAAGKFIKE